MTRLEDFKNEIWTEVDPKTGRTLEYEQIVGQSGVYLVIRDLETQEIIRDDRPWQLVNC